MSEAPTALEQFAQDLQQEVLAKAGTEDYPQLREDAFTEVVLERLAEHNDVTNAEVCYHNALGRGQLPSAKLNGWALSGDGATLDLFVVLYRGDGGKESVPKSEVIEHFKRLRGFLRRAREGFHTQLEEADDAFEVARSIHETTDTLTTVRLFFLTDGVVKSGVIEQEQMPGLELRYELWDLVKLSRLRVGERTVIELDFAKTYGGPVSCLATGGTGEYRTFLAFFPAPLLARIYGEHGQRLLERNVRAFLQAKGKVNKGLQQTLREEPQRFLAYNNGLCCTAAEVRLEEGKDGHARLKWVSDFQIVNGGQTTASIYHAWKKEKTDISTVVVQVKLTVLNDPEQVANMVPLIARYANSQNKINAADFSANGPFHHRLQQLSREVWTLPQTGLERGTHWYYERARGSYLDDKARAGTPARRRDWEQNNPAAQKFGKTDLAKFEHAWQGLPHLVCRGAEKNFLEFAQRMDDDGEPPVDLNYFQHVVARAILFRTAEKLVSAQEFGGYRANIVAYTLAWLAERSDRRIDLNRILVEQRVPQTIQEAITAVCQAANQHLLGQTGNVGEASKKEECWRAFCDRRIAFNPAWEAEWAKSSFVTPRTEDDALAVEWERVRQPLLNDARTIEGLEAYTGKSWVKTRRRDTVSAFANLTWSQLRARPNLGLKKIRDLVQMFAIATQV